MELTEKTKKMLADLLTLQETKGLTEQMLVEVCVGIVHDKEYHEPDLI
jgi:hypothetical protein